MRGMRNIAVDDAILHIVNPRTAEGLTLSTDPLDLAGQPSVRSYFASHIERTLEDDDQAKGADFTDRTTGAVARQCEDLIVSNRNLIACSQAMATRLYKVIEEDARITPADLAVCRFRDGDDPNNRTCVAIIKLDPGEAFRHERESKPDGSYRVSMLPTNVLTTTRERLHKCALVQGGDGVDRPYDMLVVDRQTTDTSDRSVAAFFLETFLEAVLATDDRRNTRALLSVLSEAENELRPALKEHQRDYLSTAVAQAAAGRQFNLEGFLSTLPLDTAHVDRIRQRYQERDLDPELALDSGYGRRMVERLKYEGDHGLRLVVQEIFRKQVIFAEREPDPANGRNYWEIELHTQQWRQVLR